MGRHIGENRSDLAAQTTWKAMLSTGSLVLLFCGAYIFAPQTLLEPFRRYADPESFSLVEPLVLKILKFVAVYSVFDAMFVVFGSAIRSAGDTRVSLLVNLLSAWFLMVLPVALMEYNGWLTLERCWYACTAHLVVCGIIFYLRFQFGPWKTMRVIEPDLTSPTTIISSTPVDSPQITNESEIAPLFDSHDEEVGPASQTPA